MRVLLDANILLSYLLPPADPNRAIKRLLASALSGSFTIVLPEALIQEFERTALTKSYFRQRVDPQDVESLVRLLRLIAEIPEAITGGIPRVVRDHADDYLLAHAVMNQVDALVTGDRDLLVLDGSVGRLSIVTASAFLELLASASESR